ncbi:MAG: hypothetical protein QM726_13120 [Chitinophagaceae bacterium]
MHKCTTAQLTGILFFALLMQSCACSKTYIGNLRFGVTQTPKTVAAGQTIDSKVNLLFSTTSVQIKFLGFQSKEIKTNHYKIEAPAEIKTDGSGVANAALWIMDTIYSFKTTNPGQYIFDFYNTDELFKSDTVMVQ